MSKAPDVKWACPCQIQCITVLLYHRAAVGSDTFKLKHGKASYLQFHGRIFDTSVVPNLGKPCKVLLSIFWKQGFVSHSREVSLFYSPIWRWPLSCYPPNWNIYDIYETLCSSFLSIRTWKWSVLISEVGFRQTDRTDFPFIIVLLKSKHNNFDWKESSASSWMNEFC